MITNNKNTLWICKGHLEKNEDQVSAALREFEEEMGLERKYLEYVGLLKKNDARTVSQADCYVNAAKPLRSDFRVAASLLAISY